MENPITNLTTRERLGLAAFAGILALLTVGGWTYRASAQSPPPHATVQSGLTASDALTLPAGNAAPKPAPSPTPLKELVVYVTGAVNRPGVYTFKPGERLYHAVRKAGGFKTSARQDALNLADQLKDADQLVVPSQEAAKKTPVIEETCSELHRDPQPTASAAKPTKANQKSAPPRQAAGRVLGRTSTPSALPATAPEPKAAKLVRPEQGTVNLNGATAEDLQRLPGIGPAMAERILAYRKEAGGFHDAIELREVRGIGEKTFARLKDLVAI